MKTESERLAVERLAEIQARVEKATRGPWGWTHNLAGKCVELSRGSGHCVGEIVMAFQRYGMSSAAPAFNIDGLLERCDSERIARIIPGREHHKEWARLVDHPDADLIAHSPADLVDLLAEVQRLKLEVNDLAEDIFDEKGGFDGKPWVPPYPDAVEKDPGSA